jgi:hypothetical protein
MCNKKTKKIRIYEEMIEKCDCANVAQNAQERTDRCQCMLMKTD